MQWIDSLMPVDDELVEWWLVWNWSMDGGGTVGRMVGTEEFEYSPSD